MSNTTRDPKAMRKFSAEGASRRSASSSPGAPKTFSRARRPSDIRPVISRPPASHNNGDAGPSLLSIDPREPARIRLNRYRMSIRSVAESIRLLVSDMS